MKTLYVIPFDEAHKYTTILKGDYEGRHFEISSYNGYPCAYVSFPEGKYVTDTGLINWNIDKAEINIDISYFGKKEEGGPIMIGWSYVSLRDYDIRHPDREDVRSILLRTCSWK